MGIRLLQRDIEILEVLHTARYMSTPQITGLFWRESHPASKDPVAGRMRAGQRRLAQLTAERLIRRIEIPVKRGEGRKPYIYTLDKEAVFVLQSIGIDPKEVQWKAKPREENYPFLEHLLATTDFRIALTLACEQHAAVELYRWVDEKELRSAADRVRLENPRTGKSQAVAVIPDAHFILRKGRVGLYALAEIDLANVTVEPTKWERKGWSRKVRAYGVYCDARTEERDGKKITQCEQRYGTPSVRILTVTSGERRLLHFKQVAEKVGADSRFWFTTFEKLTPETVLTGKIWQRATQSAPAALLD